MAQAVADALRELEGDQLEETAAAAGAALEPAAEDNEPKPYLETLPDFVSKFLTQAYRREIPAKAAWCTEWWKHPEAVCRLSGLWRSWEALRH